MEIIRKYESSFGRWYVQVMVDNAMTELSFDHEPKLDEIESLVMAMETAAKVQEESMILLEAG